MIMAVEEEEMGEDQKVVLTAPISLEGGLGDEQYQPPNLLQLIFSMFKNVRPGSDLSKFQLPPIFNIPKSHLQCYGETVYCIGEDMLSKCSKGKTSLERFTRVVAWSISTTRPMIFGQAPFNPILGETHHVSKGSLNVLLEQVSHHPPVTALHATDEDENLELIWCQYPVAKYHGTSVEVVFHGKRQLMLKSVGETYEMDSPNAQIKFIPIPWSHWVGNVKVVCKESGMVANLTFGKHGFLGLGGDHRSVRGKIIESSSLKTIYQIDGHWDRTVTLKDAHSGEVRILYNAKAALCKLKTPFLKDTQGLLSSESAMLWAKVSQGILNGDYEKARENKRSIEERERRAAGERIRKAESWIPKYFTLTQTNKGGWECLPKLKVVPPAPIMVAS